MKKICLIAFFSISALAHAQDYASIQQKLEKVHATDQHYRTVLDSLFRKAGLGWNDPQIQKLIPLAQKQDSMNLVEVRYLLDRYGWLGTNKVGKQANEAIFLVIQHADSITIEHYFPLLVQSYELGETPPKFYAMMLDRMLTDRALPQVFGTQIQMKKENGRFVPFPIENENLSSKKVTTPSAVFYIPDAVLSSRVAQA